MDAVTAHNKGQFSHLSKLTGPERVEHDGWFRVNLFDTHEKKTEKEETLSGPSSGAFERIPRYFYPFMFQSKCEKVQWQKKRKKKKERRPGPLALTA